MKPFWSHQTEDKLDKIYIFFGQQLACNIFFSVLPPLSTVLFSGLASPAAVVNKLQMCFGHPVDFHSSCRGEKTEE